MVRLCRIAVGECKFAWGQAMDKTIGQHLEEMFQEASQSYIRNLLTNEADRDEFDAITQIADDRQAELTRHYEEDYAARVEAARQRLYDEAAKLNFDHPAPPGASTNSDDTITRQAHRAVQSAHFADLQAVYDEAQRKFESILDRADLHESARGLAREVSGRALNRESRQERRSITRSQD